MTVSQVVVAGRYRLIRSLGNGGMGRVWLARDEVLRRDVAVKEVVLPVGLTEAELEELRQRTLREARAAARLSHPNVVQIYDVVRADDQPWIVMEYIPSRSLHRVIDEDGPLEPERAARIGLSVLAALGAAHRAGVLHRDVKPSNVLISDTGRVVLTDFGLATFDGGENAVTRPGLVLGSPQYIAPERARTGDSTPESDLWSLGATLYAAVEGRSPFARTTTMATLTALATERPDPMRRAGALKPVLLGLLRKNARTRLDITEAERQLRKVADNDTRRGRRLPRPRAYRDESKAVEPRADLTAVAAAPAILADPSPGATVVEVSTPSVVAGSETTRVVPRNDTPPPNPMVPPVRGRRRRMWWLVAGGLVAVLVAVAVVVRPDLPWIRQDTGNPRNTGSTATLPPPQHAPFAEPNGTGQSPLPQASGPTAIDGTALPAGWIWYQDPGGFRIAVPQFWTFSRDATMVYFREPGGDRMVSVGRWQPTTSDLVSAWTKEEADTAKVPGYQRVSISAVPGFFEACADWEYTYNGPRGERLQVINRVFRTAPGRAYVIIWRTDAFDWSVNQTYFRLIIGSFRETG
jgi:serine/threonine protein kinase